MPRKPILSVGAWVQVGFRIPIFLSAIALLAITIYMAVRWGPIRSTKIYPGAITAASIAIITDILSLIIFCYHLSWIPTVAFMDVVVLGVGIYGVVSMLFSDYHYSDMPEPKPTGWQHDDGVTFAMTLVFICLRVVALILLCIARCGRPKKQKKSKKNEDRVIIDGEGSTRVDVYK